MIRNGLIILFCIVITLTTGCAGVFVGQSNEPKIIIVRNTSNLYLKEVSLRGIGKGNGQYVRVGAISPVPNGFSQRIGRQTDPPRLPAKINVCWINEAGKESCSQIDLKNVLNGSKGHGNALVFEILDFSRVIVYLEKGGLNL